MRVTLRCDCDSVLDEFKAPEQPPGDAFRFVETGRTRSNPDSSEEAKGLERLKAAGLGDFGPSRPHVDKRFVRAPGDPEPDVDLDEDDWEVADALLPKSVVWYGCHPQRCGAGWYLPVHELEAACYDAGRAGRREVRASDLARQGAAGAYWLDRRERIRGALERMLASAKQIEAFDPADQEAEALAVLRGLQGGPSDPALADLHNQAVAAFRSLLRRAESTRRSPPARARSS
jgi:Arc/MetJ-type ribon-helix-helix transcriptional regulator